MTALVCVCLQQIFAVGVQNELEISRSAVTGVDRERNCDGATQRAAVLSQQHPVARDTELGQSDENGA